MIVPILICSLFFIWFSLAFVSFCFVFLFVLIVIGFLFMNQEQRFLSSNVAIIMYWFDDDHEITWRWHCLIVKIERKTTRINDWIWLIYLLRSSSMKIRRNSISKVRFLIYRCGPCWQMENDNSSCADDDKYWRRGMTSFIIIGQSFVEIHDQLIDFSWEHIFM